MCLNYNQHKGIGEYMNDILIVVDMQNDFIDGALGTNEAIAVVDRAKEKISEFDGDIILTYDTHFDNYLDTSEGKNLPVPHCIKGTHGWQLNKKISSALTGKKYKTFEKTTFGSTELVHYINANYSPDEIKLELIGLCTDICVVSNALLLKAAFPETEISVDARCCAGVTPESHNAALLTMKMCQINIIDK